MDSNNNTMPSTFSGEGSVPLPQLKMTPQANGFLESWDALDADDKAQKEVILNKHFPKALERFNAGVSLTKIRKHYEKLGAKFSPVTFRRKWNELVKRCEQRI